MSRKCKHSFIMKSGFLLKKKPRVETMEAKDTHWSNKKNLLMFLGKVQNDATSACLVRNLVGQMLLKPGITNSTKEAMMLIDDPYVRGMNMSKLYQYKSMQDVDPSKLFKDVIKFEDDKIVEINFQLLDKLHGMDLVMASTFRYAGLYTKIWRTIVDNTGVPNFPPNLDYFRNLEVIDLCQITMTCYIHFPDLSMLPLIKELNLGGCLIRGDFPQWIHKWKQLETFCICGTSIGGSIPESIGECTKLTKLCITNSDVSSNLPCSILKCTKMKILNAITKKQDSTLRRLDHLWKAMPELNTVSLWFNIELNRVDFSCIQDREFEELRIKSQVTSATKAHIPLMTNNNKHISASITSNSIFARTNSNFSLFTFPFLT